METKISPKNLIYLSSFLLLSLICFTNSALAQIKSDRSLGQEKSVVRQINPELQHLEGGAIRGQNLFHSFLEFNIQENASAYFANPQGISNIFSRVTGNNISQINGTLGVLGDANLFLVNPNGIMFGANAQLDITGSFVASSGNAFVLPNGIEFSATNPQVPLLTVTATAPIGVKFEGSQGTITNQANLKVPQGQSISLIDLPKNNSVSTLIQPSTLKSDSVVPDNTLGSESSQVQAIDPNSELIVGGATRGINLFHSFLKFGVGADKGVDFYNPQGIENILARVTGDNISRIRGTLGVKGGNADLYIINPNGLLFNQTASLDLNGSFIASTASAIVFEKFDYRTVNPNFPPVLVGAKNGNSSSPTGLRIGNSSNAINLLNDKLNTSVIGNLGVKPEQTLALIGGDVRLNNIQVTSPSSNLILGGLSQGGIVNLETNLQVSFPQSVTKADVQLLNSSILDVTGNNGGRVEINAGNMSIKNSEILAGIREGLVSPKAQAGDIKLNVSNQFNIENSIIQNSVNQGAIGNAGKILVETKNLVLINGGRIEVSTLGKGNFGAIEIQATQDIVVKRQGTEDFNSAILSKVEPEARGDSDGIRIRTKNLSIFQGGAINTSTRGKGSAGLVDINAEEKIEIIGARNNGIPGGIFSQVTDSAQGSKGEINLQTKFLYLSDRGIISSRTFGESNAGLIKINAIKSIIIDGKVTGGNGMASGIISTVDLGALGNSEGIVLDTPLLELNNGGRININTTFGKGEVGKIIITAETIRLEDNSTIEINRLNFDPIEGLRDLPSKLVEVEIARGCDASRAGNIAFYDVGKGGLVPQPEDYIRIKQIPWNQLTIPQSTDNSWLLSPNAQSPYTYRSPLKTHFSCSQL